MSGPIHGKAYHVASTTGFNITAQIGWCLKDYFDSHPGFRRISWYSGTTAGSGENRQYEGSPIGERAFFVYRAVSSSAVITGSNPSNVPAFDFAFSISYNELTNTNPRAWRSANDFGLTAAMAWHSSGRAWSGGSANAGADSFTAGASAPFSASSLVFPRVNGTSGTDATNRNGMVTLDTGAGTNAFVVCSGDNDTIFIGIGNPSSNNGSINMFMVVGGYEPITGSYNVPLTMWTNIIKGNPVGSTTTRDGGGIATTSSAGVRIARIEHYSNTYGVDKTVNGTNNGKFLTEFPITLYQYEASNYRTAGFLHNIRVANDNVQNMSLFLSGSQYRLALRTSDFDSASPTITIPWPSSSFSTIKV